MLSQRRRCISSTVIIFFLSKQKDLERAAALVKASGFCEKRHRLLVAAAWHVRPRTLSRIVLS